MMNSSIVIGLDTRPSKKGMQPMSQRVHHKYPPRTRVYLRPGTSTTKTTHRPNDARIFGPPITTDELHARLVLRKAF